MAGNGDERLGFHDHAYGSTARTLRHTRAARRAGGGNRTRVTSLEG